MNALAKTILITGGAGFIGSHLAEALRDRYRIILFDNLRRNSLPYAPSLGQDPRVELVVGDILDEQAVRQAVARADIVLHLAAIAGVSSYYSQAVTTLRVNILGTLNVLEAMRADGAKRLVEFSTSEVYGSQAELVREDSTHQIGPVHEKRWVYAVSKLTSENLALRFGEEYSLACTCVRPFNIYGPRQTGEGAISNFCTAAIQGKPLVVEGDGSDTRAWCYISDMVEAVERILHSDQAAGQSFNIGNPSASVSTLELAQVIVDENRGGEIVHRPAPHAPIRKRSPDITKAQELLGFHPQVPLHEGIRYTLSWYRETTTA